MAYGFQSYTTNNDLQLDSTKEEMSGLIVVQGGTGSSISNVQSNELVFARYGTGTTDLCHMKQSGTTRTFHEAGPLETAKNVDWLVCARAADLSVSTSGYGVQVWNEDLDLQYDSGKYTNQGGVSIASIAPSGDQHGNPVSDLSNPISTDTSEYVCMDAGFWNSHRHYGSYRYYNNYSSGGSTYTGIWWEAKTLIPGPGGGTTYWRNGTDCITVSGGSV